MINWFDIVVLIPLIFAAFKGFQKGFIIEISSVVALLFGIYGAIGLRNFTADYLKEKVEIQESFMPTLAFIITFVAIVVAVYFLAKLLEGVIKIAALGVINRIGGLLIGVLKMVFIISGLIMIVNKIDSNRKLFDKAVEEKSVFYSPIQKAIPFVFPSIKNFYMPAQRIMEEKMEELKPKE